MGKAVAKTGAMNVGEAMAWLEAHGSEQARKIYARHGAPPEIFGVKVADLKILQKKLNKDHALALELFATGNGDAMYFAALIADEKQATAKQLEGWAKAAKWATVGVYGVAALAAEAGLGMGLGTKWIDAKEPHVAAIGWAALSHHVGITPDESIDMKALGRLLKRVEMEIASAPNGVRRSMNMFVIAVGCGVEPLSAEASATGERIGQVAVDVGDTDCKIPFAPDYIAKVAKMGRIGRKRKMARC